MQSTYLQSVDAAVSELKAGRMILLGDAQAREHEYDFVARADCISQAQLNVMRRHGSGIICVSMSPDDCERLQLRPMVMSEYNNSPHSTPFTVAVDAAQGTSSGVSMADRQCTIKKLADKAAVVSDFVRPGHVFPLQAHPEGVLARAGHTEASLDLVRMAGANAAVICEAMTDSGKMLRSKHISDFACLHNMPVLSIEDLVDYQLRFKPQIISTASAHLPTPYGDFTMTVVKDRNGLEHAMLHGEKITLSPCPLRIHSACLSGDVFASLRCDCGPQLAHSLRQLQKVGGVLLYMQQEGRGIGLYEKIKSYALQQQGYDTVDANLALGHGIDHRNYAICAHMLAELAIGQVELWTHNPDKVDQLRKYGIDVVAVKPMPVFRNPYNQCYLRSKRNRLQHHL